AVQLSPAQIILMLTAAAASAAITGQVASIRLASHLERAHDEYTQLERQARATEEALTNKLEVAHDAYTELQRQARATAEELTNKLEVARNDLERQTKASKEKLEMLDSKVSSHALVEVPGVEEPVLLRFIDLTTKQHQFTVQIPLKGHFSFW